MAITFTDEKHEYKSIDNDGIDWISATSLISYFKQPFDAKTQSVKSSKNKKSKWYGMTPEAIVAAWDKESKRATDLGTWYHNQREKDLCDLETIGYKGHDLPIIKPVIENGVKYAPDQRLQQGVYPEIMVYLKSAGICGQGDKGTVYTNIVDVDDYKTNKEIKEKGYTNWEGITQKMLAPLNNLDDCHISHYALQLSLYMFIILKHNPSYKPGKLTVHHVLFEEAGRDEFDYPITALNIYGEPVIKEIKYYDLPYLKDEVIRMLNYSKINRKQILAKKAA
jgi:hypothetical protein